VVEAPDPARPEPREGVFAGVVEEVDRVPVFQGLDERLGVFRDA
jgi:hypothetical protein